MSRKCLMTASTISHLSHFHKPYIDEFRKMGWEVHAAGAQAGTLKTELFADKIIPMQFEKSFLSVSNFRAAAQLRKLMKQERYDLIICHTSLAAFFTRLAILGIKKETKLINVAHGYLFDESSTWYKSAILKAAEYLAAPVTDLVLTMNDWDYQWARAHRVAKSVGIIPGMGVDAEKMQNSSRPNRFGFSEDDFVLIYPAEFSKRKNQVMLIKAMTRLPEHVKLVLPGEGALLEECKSLAQRLDVAERVVFPGYVREIGGALSGADAAVSSARSEGLPFNVLEAMHSGLPVIASAVKGNTDLVHDGENGLTYPYDDADAFAAAVLRLMEDDKLRRSMGQAGKEMVKQYTLDEVLPKVMQEYLSVL